MQAYTNEPAFINRQTEMAFLQSYIGEKPNSILFIYGPKSSGKTTLLYRFIDNYLTNDANSVGNTYEIKHFNLRKLLLVNYESFLRAFFELKSSEQVKETREYDLKVFKLSVEVIKGLEAKAIDPFVVMDKELQKSVKKGIRPVIIIDELQALDHIYFNGGRELLKEMFNFFVAMTKESHLCHVIVASSDGYFIDRIYNDSKLNKTSDFIEIGYINRQDVMQWLGDIRKYSKIDRFTLSEEQKLAIWNFFGGSCWEISNFLGHLVSGAKNGRVQQELFDNLLKKRLSVITNMYEDRVGLNIRQQRFWKCVSQIIRNKSGFRLRELASLVQDNLFTESELRIELNELVRHNFLSYAPPRAEYALQGKSMELGLWEYVNNLD